MKSVLLALAVILACVAYEVDRGARPWADRRTEPVIDGQAAGTARVWIPRDAVDSVPAAGRVEREHSIRLFGPGISRQRQTRV